MRDLRGLATGIGSLPHKDADSALDLIFEYVPEIPFWPQLPRRDIREGMIAQFSEGLPCIKVNDEGVFFDPRDKEKELKNFYEKIISKDLEYFKISEDFARGLYAFEQRLQKIDRSSIKRIKCHITGPFTFAAAIKDENGTPILHNHELMQAVIEGLIMKTLWQIRFLEKFGKKIIVFVDEPYLGCFGSAYTPINREDVVKVLKEIAERIITAGTVQSGVHCCGNTDWSIFTDIKALDIINFDAYGFLDKFVLYADNIKAFLQRGGIICWGIVPTQLFTGQESAELLIRKIKDGIARLQGKGLEENLLLQNLLTSPSCGLGTLAPEESGKIFKLLYETSSLIRKYE
jgi:methionine synthase II (cobalamin-independent)